MELIIGLIVGIITKYRESTLKTKTIIRTVFVLILTPLIIATFQVAVEEASYQAESTSGVFTTRQLEDYYYDRNYARLYWILDLYHPDRTDPEYAVYYEIAAGYDAYLNWKYADADTAAEREADFLALKAEVTDSKNLAQFERWEAEMQ